VHYLQDLESRVDEIRRQMTDLDLRARERMALMEERDGEQSGLRRRIATALISLGSRIDPEAVDASSADNKAA
jgi:hypothetical protein